MPAPFRVTETCPPLSESLSHARPSRRTESCLPFSGSLSHARPIPSHAGLERASPFPSHTQRRRLGLQGLTSLNHGQRLTVLGLTVFMLDILIFVSSVA